jgi:hypothetical protein
VGMEWKKDIFLYVFLYFLTFEPLNVLSPNIHKKL